LVRDSFKRLPVFGMYLYLLVVNDGLGIHLPLARTYFVVPTKSLATGQ